MVSKTNKQTNKQTNDNKTLLLSETLVHTRHNFSGIYFRTQCVAETVCRRAISSLKEKQLAPYKAHFWTTITCCLDIHV